LSLIHLLLLKLRLTLLPLIFSMSVIAASSVVASFADTFLDS